MKVTKVEVVRSKKPIVLPEDWKPAWWEPDVEPVRSFGFAPRLLPIQPRSCRDFRRKRTL